MHTNLVRDKKFSSDMVLIKNDTTNFYFIITNISKTDNIIVTIEMCIS